MFPKESFTAYLFTQTLAASSSPLKYCKGQAIDEYQYVNSAGDGIELKPGDYELTVDEPPVATDGTRFRASKRMVPVSFNSQAPDTVDSTPQGGFDLYAIAQ